MKTDRIITLLTVFIAAISVFAQKQLTVVNEDTGESFEVTVPEGLRIYEYNENWLDSIPYIMEHARNREGWAYENLARCYRYGIGVEKCITNATIYYEKANIDGMELAEEAYEADPTDEFGFMNHLMENLDKKGMSIEEAINKIKEYPNPKPSWMERMMTIFDNRHVEDFENYLKSSIDWDTVTGDELLAYIACVMILRPDTPSIMSIPPKSEFMKFLIMAAEKIPVLYKVGGDKYWDLYSDCPDDEQAMKSAFDLYHKAYLYGLLEMREAIAVLDYRDENTLYDGFPFTEDELAHLDSFYSKECRLHFHEPYVTEEIVYDANPVELIEEE